MRSLIPFDGLFGNTVLDHFFDDDMPTVYQDYTAVPKVDIEDKKDHYEITCDMPGFKKEEIHISYENGILSLGAKKEDKKDADVSWPMPTVPRPPCRRWCRPPLRTSAQTTRAFTAWRS